MKKVLLLTASFGDGHNQVAQALMQEFAKIHVETVTIDIFRSTSRKAAKLNEGLYERLTRYIPSIYGLSYYATAHLALNHWLWQGLSVLSRKAVYQAIKENNPDIVLQMFPDHALHTFPRCIKKRPRIGVVLTDYAIHSRWFHSGVDFYCFPHAVSANYAKPWILSNQDVQITGIPLRSQFATTSNHHFDPVSPYAVVATGGRGVFPDLNLVIPEIRAAFPSVKILVLCGRNIQILNRVKQFQEKDPLIDAIPFTEDIATVYRNAMFAVVKAGGLTVAECHATGCPMVFYKPMSGQERVNASVCEQLGTGVVAKDIKEFRKQILTLTNESLYRMRNACSHAAMPYAAREVVSITMRSFV